MTGPVSMEALRDSLRTQLWPVPLTAALLALAAGQYLPKLDRELENHLPATVSELLFGGGPEAAQALIETIAGSLITVTSLTFSLTVVTLQLASSQFSPRLLRTFSRDRFVHNTLGLFLGTFVFSLTVLRSIRAETSAGDGFVPKISVTVAFLLTVGSVIALVFFLAHLARQIRVETMMRDVHREASAAIARIFPEKGPIDLPEFATGATGGILIESASSGFLLSIDADSAVAAAVAGNAVILIEAAPGDSLISGVPFARSWATDGQLIDGKTQSAMSDKLNKGTSTGFERTSAQDAGYGLQQLLDVACRALSPGINDPTTAVHALGHISALLCAVSTRNTGPKVLYDTEGQPRVVVNYPTFEKLFEQVMMQMLTYGMDDPRTADRLVRLLRELSWVAGDGRHAAVIGHHFISLRAALSSAPLSQEDKDRLIGACAAETRPNA